MEAEVPGGQGMSLATQNVDDDATGGASLPTNHALEALEAKMRDAALAELVGAAAPEEGSERSVRINSPKSTGTPEPGWEQSAAQRSQMAVELWGFRPALVCSGHALGRCVASAPGTSEGPHQQQHAGILCRLGAALRGAPRARRRLRGRASWFKMGP